MCPCLIIDNLQALRDIVKESAAYPTYDGDENILKGKTGEEPDELSTTWHELSLEINDKRLGIKRERATY